MAGVVAYACIPELAGVEGGKDSKIAGTFQPLSLAESTRDPVSRNKVMSMFEEDRKINIWLTHTHLCKHMNVYTYISRTRANNK